MQKAHAKNAGLCWTLVDLCDASERTRSKLAMLKVKSNAAIEELNAEVADSSRFRSANDRRMIESSGQVTAFPSASLEIPCTVDSGRENQAGRCQGIAVKEERKSDRCSNDH
jgi:hypothetical protein